MSSWRSHRVQTPTATLETQYHPGQPAKLALLAHPLGKLGGSFNDGVVLALADLCLQLGYSVARVK
jgi:alpha/beta superfamily hydrolase